MGFFVYGRYCLRPFQTIFRFSGAGYAHRNLLRTAVFAVLAALLLACLPAQAARAPKPDQLAAVADQIAALANASRAQAGLPPLQWDDALAVAAHAHAVRMAAEGPIAHRYGGEMSLAERAAAAGAHFDLVEENIAIGNSAQQIHALWMHSAEHHANLMNPQINRIGVAVVAARGVLYTVADYAQAVRTLTFEDQESMVAQQLTPLGIATRTTGKALEQARAACASGSGVPSSPGLQPLFVMRWQSGSLHQLPSALVQRIRTGHYQSAAVGACAPHAAPTQEQAAFTAYRVTVLLY